MKCKQQVLEQHCHMISLVPKKKVHVQMNRLITCNSQHELHTYYVAGTVPSVIHGLSRLHLTTANECDAMTVPTLQMGELRQTSSIPKVTQLLDGRAKISVLAVWLWSWSSLVLHALTPLFGVTRQFFKKHFEPLFFLGT